MFFVHNRLTLRTKIALFIAVFLWASAFVGIRAALEEFSPEGLALLRYLIASVLMGIIYYRLPKQNSIATVDIVLLLIVGMFSVGIYNVSLNYGELAISSGMASFIISQSPIITAIFAILFLKERLNFFYFIGFVISFIGVVFIAIGEQGGFKWDVNVYFILIATLAAGFYSILQKPFLQKYHAISVTTYIIWGGTLFLLIFLPPLQKDLAHASLKATLAVIYLGIFPAALGYIAWSYVLAEIPASRAVSFLYCMPFIATILGWLLLGELPALLSIMGGILAICGIFVVNYASKKN